MKISKEDKRRLLIQRGFTAEEIDNGFRDYINGTYLWRIRCITSEKISKTDALEDLKRLFYKDSVDQEICGGASYINDFEYYASRRQYIRNDQLNAAILDPYVARIVLAVNKCGIFTSMSCDGWHRDDVSKASISDLLPRYLVIWMSDRYSTLWFWIIAEFIFGEAWPKQEPLKAVWNGIFEPDDNFDNVIPGRPSKVICQIKKGEEKKSYKKINLYAEFLEEHCEMLLEIREKWIDSLQRSMSPVDINEQNFLKLRKCISSAVNDDLNKMSELWKQKIIKTYENEIQAWDFAGT